MTFTNHAYLVSVILSRLIFLDRILLFEKKQRSIERARMK
jgi:hypothetical protein